MITEDLSMYKDGIQMDERDIATVITYLDNTVIFQDDFGKIFFYPAEPSAFEIGTIEPVSALTPIEDADSQLKSRIIAAIEGSGK